MFIRQDSQNVAIKDKSLSKLLIRAAAGFLSLLSEAIPAGMLFDISSDLGITSSQASQFVTMYAAGCAVSAIPLSIATRNIERRSLLLTILIAGGMLNVITPLSDDYHIILIVRFLTGITGGLLWATLSGYARSMVSAEKKGRAVAIAYAGVPLALALGIPVGAFLVETIGWKAIFVAIAGMTLLMAALTLKLMPKVSMPQNRMLSTGRRIAGVLTNPAMLAVLLINLLWATAHNTLYTFILPILATLGLEAQSGILLMNFGMSSVFGIFIIGLFIDRNLPRLTIICLGLFLLAATVIMAGSHSLFVATLAVMIWGCSYGGASALLPAASAEASGEDADIAQSVLSTAHNLSLSLGGALGGLMLSQNGEQGLSLLIFLIALLALAVAVVFRRRGLLRGRQSTH